MLTSFRCAHVALPSFLSGGDLIALSWVLCWPPLSSPFALLSRIESIGISCNCSVISRCTPLLFTSPLAVDFLSVAFASRAPHLGVLRQSSVCLLRSPLGSARIIPCNSSPVSLMLLFSPVEWSLFLAPLPSSWTRLLPASHLNYGLSSAPLCGRVLSSSSFPCYIPSSFSPVAPSWVPPLNRGRSCIPLPSGSSSGRFTLNSGLVVHHYWSPLPPLFCRTPSVSILHSLSAPAWRAALPTGGAGSSPLRVLPPLCPFLLLAGCPLSISGPGS